MDKLQVYNLFRKNKKLKKGKLLTFEGLDGSSKETQTNNLISYLEKEGYKVLKVDFPNYDSPIGEVISSYLRGEFGKLEDVPLKLISMVYSSDRARYANTIENHIKNGGVVIANRYTYSNLFHAAKMEKEERTEFIDWIEEIEFNEMKVFQPDYNFYLYVDPTISLKRIEERGKRGYQEGKEDIHENNSKLLIDTAETYLDFAKSRDNWVIIDQMKKGKQLPIDVVFEMIKDEVNKILIEE
ncbi:thymidylate kinase [Bacillus phage G]|uniref:dTMP kinase n=1 Tax=Bacillus phage G TaxID=2884420 RepID=G3MB74_9CAUD|nr:thymidylate kinase [Bacillus phage G]AEO93937.1 gp694 [Bacillus phage G]